jgi:hypothetical protein
LIASAEHGTVWFGRRLAVMETGFSTNAITRGQKEQKEYFEKLPIVVNNLKGLIPGNDILLGVYELCDRDSSALLDPESHFGLLTSDLNPKSAFTTVMKLIAAL